MDVGHLSHKFDRSLLPILDSTNQVTLKVLKLLRVFNLPLYPLLPPVLINLGGTYIKKVSDEGAEEGRLAATNVTNYTHKLALLDLKVDLL